MFRTSLLLIILSIVIFSNMGNAQNISNIEKQVESTIDLKAKVDLYLEEVEDIVWSGGSEAKARKYIENILELCENEDCHNLEFLAYAYLAEINMNLGDYSTVENIISPKLKDNSINEKIIEAHLEEVVGMYYVLQGNSSKAIESLTKSRFILEESNSKPKRLSNIYYYLAFAHNINGTNKESIEMMNLSIEQDYLNKDTLHLINSIAGLGTLHSTDGNYQKSIELILSALEMMEGIDDEMQKYTLYDSLIDSYIRNEDYEKANTVLDKIIPEFNALGLKMQAKANTIWSFHMSKAKVLGRMENAEEALVSVDSAYVYAEYINDFVVRITDLRQANLTLQMGRYGLASMKLERLLEEMKKLGDSDAFNAVLAGLFADLYIESGFEPREKTRKELQLIVDRVIEKNKGQSNSDMMDAQKLSIVLGIYNFKKDAVVKSFQNYEAIKDSIHHQEKLKVSNELLIQYEIKEKEKELKINELLLIKKTTERNILMIIAGTLLLGIGFLFLFFQQRKKYTLELEKDVKRRTLELEATNESLKQSNDELERYTYIASHDLKEPLRNITSFVNLIKRRNLIDNKDALIYFDFVEKGTNQMDTIVNDLLEFSELRTKDTTIENIELFDVFENAKETVLKENFNKKININSYNLNQIIQSDHKFLFTIFKQIIENGIKYNKNPEVKIHVSYEWINDLHQIEIKDNGLGIEEEYIDSIFTSFKRLHNRSEYNGSGAGLAICKRLVEYLKGTISVESKINKGSTFIIKLPKY